MCLAAFTYGLSDDYALVFAANRDELHERPAAAADWWTDHPHILGGRDLLAGGTWLAMDQRGRLAAVTNAPSAGSKTHGKSRGHLISDYLKKDQPATDFLARLRAGADEYGPYNLLIYDGGRFHYFSNRAPTRELPRGTYALSNARLGTPWPKVEFAAARLPEVMSNPHPAAAVFELLENREAHGSEATDRRTSSVFIQDATFGTRCSTVILVSIDGEVEFLERRYNPDGTHAGDSAHRFSLETNPVLEASR